jgi:hypothetical protein
VSDVVLKASGEHDGNSHVQDKSVHLTVSQRSTLKRAIKSAPNESARQLVRNSSNFSPGKRTGQDPDSIRSAQRLIAQERRSLALSHTSGVQLDTSNGAMTQLGDKMALEKLIARHNDPDDDYHLNLHQVVCIGNQWKKGVTFMEVSTPHFLFNAGRAMQTGWELQVQADGSFDFCAAKLGVIVFGVNSLRGIFRPVSWSLVPNESSEAFGYAYNGIRAAFFGLLKPGAVRLCPARPGHSCAFCEQLLDIQKAPEVARVLSDPQQKLPVKRAGSDNTTKWTKFAKKILLEAKVIVCYTHATGDAMLIPSIYFAHIFYFIV